MKSLTEKIEHEVERLVREHLAACEVAAGAAVRSAFRRASSQPSKPARTRAKGSRPASRRRTPEEIAALGERLYEVICRHPGETIAVIAPAVGASPRELRRPSVLLRRAGRVRSVGQRHGTRYFPMGE